MLGVINDTLDFSKLEAGKVELELDDFGRSRVVDEVASLLALTAHAGSAHNPLPRRCRPIVGRESRTATARSFTAPADRLTWIGQMTTRLVPRGRVLPKATFRSARPTSMTRGRVRALARTGEDGAKHRPQPGAPRSGALTYKRDSRQTARPRQPAHDSPPTTPRPRQPALDLGGMPADLTGPIHPGIALVGASRGCRSGQA